MIDLVEILNFKRFRSAEVALRPLTLLTGLNGTGKSTLLQAVLLAKQVAEIGPSGSVLLNDVHGLALGEAQDVLHPLAEDQEIDIRLTCGSERLHVVFEVPVRRSLNLAFEVDGGVPASLALVSGRRFAYLNAERLGPRDQHAMTGADIDSLGVGERGQFTAQVLAAHETSLVADGLLHPDTESRARGVRTLRTQVELWASEIIRPIEITAAWRPGLSTSTIRFREPGLFGGEIRPGNTGFGISYALPIIVAGLRMEPGGVLIVENPEAHLHPAGQSRIGRFLALLAFNGVQVVVETHSDHVLNGVRLAVAEGRCVPHHDVLVHYFSFDDADSTPTSIGMTERGSLDVWPKGFFDQLDVDLGGLSRAGRDRR
ncbi:DUF3696 domain-containing protein [Saccharothrix violaceirubra]|uniref:Putative ATPase n=1 Tax=Saccharothrix violaceirubra TaxID=413306 RepID=A0A7W7X007_9PSEU|nr:DUF3696 domain-containing protein [Saccharothrix violaceirubra]MBB4969393.1 putative ATPase [Saccharothrix violaceirubra]